MTPTKWIVKGRRIWLGDGTDADIGYLDQLLGAVGQLARIAHGHLAPQPTNDTPTRKDEKPCSPENL
jgi:hypothetical protein